MKSEIVRSLMERHLFENEELTQRADNVRNYEETIPIVREYETIIKSQKKGILNVAFRQGINFKKFKESEKLYGNGKGSWR